MGFYPDPTWPEYDGPYFPDEVECDCGETVYLPDDPKTDTAASEALVECPRCGGTLHVDRIA